MRIWVLILVAVSAAAQSLHWEHLGVTSGINYAFAFEQTPDGRLWIGTQDGLWEYDGQTFLRIGPERGIPPGPVSYVAVSGQELWLCHAEGIFRQEGERFVRVAKPGVEAATIAADPQGKVYFAAPHLHIARRTPQGWQVREEPTLVPNGTVRIGTAGDIWFGCGQEICQLEAATLRQLPAKLLPKRWGLKEGVPAKLWWDAAMDGNGILVGTVRGNDPLWRKFPGRPMRLEGNLFDTTRPVGSLWFPYWLSARKGFQSLDQPQLPMLITSLIAFYRDRHGTVWSADSGRGIWRAAKDPGVEAWGKLDGFSDSLIFQQGRIANGSLIAATPKGPHQLPNGSHHWLPFAKNWPLTTLAPLPGGGALLAFVRHTGLQRVDSAGRITGEILTATGDRLRPQRLMPDAQGGVWISTQEELYRLPPGGSRASRVELVPGRWDHRDILIDKKGTVWVAFQKGLARLENGRWRIFSTQDGLKSDYTRCLAMDASGHLWVSYRMAIGFSKLTIEGDRLSAQHFDTASGHGSNSTFLLGADRRGWVWRGTNDGMYVKRGASDAPGDWLHLTTFDGLPANDINIFSFFEDRDGSVWFGTVGGNVHIGPAAIEAIARQQFRVRVTQAGLADGVLSAQVNPIYLGRRDRLQYRYRVAGTDTWTTTFSPELKVAGLPYGDHSLEVQARRTGAVWSESAALPFLYPRPWWQSARALLFYALSGVGIAAWWRSISNRRRREQQQFEAEKALFVELSGLPAEQQETRLRQVAPELAERVRRLLSSQSAGEDRDVILNNRYRLGPKVAQGGMSTIYRAWDQRLAGRLTAIKILRPDLGDPEWLIRRFELEREALSRISHPGVISVLDAGQTPQGLAFLAMEFVEGPTLRQVLTAGPLTPARIARLLRQTVEALDAADTAGVTHRDLKPENLMLRRAGEPDEQMVVVDFGIAVVRNPGSETLVLSRAAGSLDYMAPEQTQGRATPAADLYALGLIVFEMLTGQRPAQLDLGHHADFGDDVIRHLSGSWPVALAELVGAALSFDPKTRPASVKVWGEAVARELERPLAARSHSES
ncbi:MAG: protein kinase [Acidobacteria bacterium]|nr:protein kinase [Acidobacteriota bacterium]